jgi:hypothetical protein
MAFAGAACKCFCCAAAKLSPISSRPLRAWPSLSAELQETRDKSAPTRWRKPMRFPQHGGCSCGKTRYAITVMPILTFTCHCTACQTQTGNAFSTALVLNADACKFEAGEMRPRTRVADSGRSVTWWTCAECGTWISSGAMAETAWSATPGPGTARPATPAPATYLRLRAGTLDDTTWLRPTAHFWTRSAQPWIVLPADAVIFPTQPDDAAAWLQSHLAHLTGRSGSPHQESPPGRSSPSQ